MTAIKEAEALLEMGAEWVDAGTLRAVLAELYEARKKINNQRRQLNALNRACEGGYPMALSGDALIDTLRAQTSKVRGEVARLAARLYGDGDEPGGDP